LVAEPLGIAFAFANAALFSAYIVLAHRASRYERMGGIDGLGAAMLIAMVVVTPLGGWEAAPAFSDPIVMLAGGGVGVAASGLPPSSSGTPPSGRGRVCRTRSRRPRWRARTAPRSAPWRPRCSRDRCWRGSPASIPAGAPPRGRWGPHRRPATWEANAQGRCA